MATKKLQMLGYKIVPPEHVGKSAYEIAVDKGFKGTEEEWLESLKAEVSLEELGGVADEQLADRMGEIVEDQYMNGGPIDEYVWSRAFDTVYAETYTILQDNGLVNYDDTTEEWVSHAYDTNNPHQVTAEQIGAAPAGFGLGGPSVVVDNWDFAIENGFYANNADTTDEHAPFPGEAAWGYTISYGLTGDITQVAFAHLTVDGRQNLYQKIRHCNGESWGEWEWVNPPFYFDKEYRTTERYLGRPVYAKMIRYGQFPTVGERRTISVSTPNKATLVRHSVVSGGTNLVVDRCITYLFFSDTSLTLENTNADVADNPNMSCYVLVYYTKSTD